MGRGSSGGFQPRRASRLPPFQCEHRRNNVRIGSAVGPTLPSGWQLVRAADFNADGHPDYLLFNSTTRATMIWYLNNNVHVGSDWAPTLPVEWMFATS